MTPSQLADHAMHFIVAGQSRMTLTLPPKWKPPKGFPRGELLSVNAAGERNVSFDAMRVLAWCERNLEGSK